jgi:hypothetical protein
MPRIEPRRATTAVRKDSGSCAKPGIVDHELQSPNLELQFNARNSAVSTKDPELGFSFVRAHRRMRFAKSIVNIVINPAEHITELSDRLSSLIPAATNHTVNRNRTFVSHAPPPHVNY